MPKMTKTEEANATRPTPAKNLADLTADDLASVGCKAGDTSKAVADAEAEFLANCTAVDMLAEDDITKTTSNTMYCPCGRIFNNQDDFDTLGSDSGMCCPDCGAEEFTTITALIAENKALAEQVAELKKQKRGIGITIPHIQR